MTRSSVYLFALLAAAMFMIAPQTTRAAEGYDNCTNFITSLPTVIGTQGTWCLKQNLSSANTSGSAITINANNVTIDCNDFKLDGLAAGSSTSAYGISATNRLNATVRRCDIRGFFKGVFLNGSSGGGHLVEDSYFDGNTFTGVWVEGDGSVVRRNRLLHSGGSSGFTIAYGLAAFNAVDIRDNAISGVTAKAGGNGFVIGIFTDSNTRGRITGNAIRDLHPDGTGTMTGIYNNLSDRVDVLNNDVIGDGSTGSLGLYCGSGTGSARDNVVNGFVTSSNCVNGGGNDFTP